MQPVSYSAENFCSLELLDGAAESIVVVSRRRFSSSLFLYSCGRSAADVSRFVGFLLLNIERSLSPTEIGFMVSVGVETDDDGDGRDVSESPDIVR